MNGMIWCEIKMNERIDQLAEQATTIVEMVGPQGYTSSYANFDREKFAELIIKETLQIARVGIEYGDGMEDAVYKYFGVEE